LEGKGFFAVSRDESRPFVVRTDVGQIEVLGTRFQVRSEEEYVETVVVEGLVKVTNGQGSVQVPAGSLSRMDDGEEPLIRAVDDVYAFLDWPQGTLVFHATPLNQVVEEVARHYGREIHLEGPELSLRRVTAWFQGEGFEAVAESLCMVTEAVCQTEEGTLTMAPRGSGER
jgi:transmembrane sensor